MTVALVLVFIAGYLCIVLEHPLKVDKAAFALATAVLCWVLLLWSGHGSADALSDDLRDELGDIAEILFFLLGAMAIVEMVAAHDGFRIITDSIHTRSRVKLLWLIGLLSFFLSAALDNMTTTIVMVSLLRQILADARERWTYAGIVVIAANAGGAWSPIGDVTTTMLWIGGQITSTGVITGLFLPSLACLLIPLAAFSLRLRGEVQGPSQQTQANTFVTTDFERKLVFALGIGALLFVPIFKAVTHLPPFMGMLLALGVLWVVTDRIHRHKSIEERQSVSMVAVLNRIDTTSVLFFLGILLAVASLSQAGVLHQVAQFLRDTLGNVYAITIAIGGLSAVVDNVPLVAGAIQMYPLTPVDAASADPWLSALQTDGLFWTLLAYCAGTGGSCLIIGSAAGVAAMGLERIQFFWYLKHISLWALLGYLGGVLVYALQQSLL